ncbi:MAG: hypothetical protein ACLSA0_29120 [Eisenbergiella massiliensis]
MFTKRLYDENSYIREFDARVLSCEEGKNGYEVVLDESAFFSRRAADSLRIRAS